MVFDQNLKNNSNAYLINTNVTRNGGFDDANVTGGGFALKNEKQTYGQKENSLHRSNTVVDRTVPIWDMPTACMQVK